MKPLKPSDKRALTILVLFLIGVGVYLLLFAPLAAEKEKLAKTLKGKSGDLKQRQRVIRETTSWREDAERLYVESAEVLGKIRLSAYAMTPEQIISELSSMGRRSGCAVVSIRPVTGNSADDVTESDSYIVNGKGELSAVLRYIRNVDGLSLADISITAAEQGETALTFYLRFKTVPKGNIETVQQIVAASGVRVKDEHTPETVPVSHVNSLLTSSLPKLPVMPPSTANAPADTPPPTPADAGIRPVALSGIATLGQKNYALLTYGSDSYYYAAGDRIGDYTVKQITEAAVTLEDSKGAKMVLKLDEGVSPSGALTVEKSDVRTEKQSAPEQKKASGANQPPVAKKKQGRLGMQVQESVFNGAASLLVTADPAQTDAVRKGDRIVQINGIRVGSVQQGADALRTVYAGDVITLGILRNGAVTDIQMRAVE